MFDEWTPHAETEAESERDIVDLNEAKRAALSYITEAFTEAQLDGLDGDCVAHAALFAAFRELVETYGEEAVAVFSEGIPERIRTGSFTATFRH